MKTAFITGIAGQDGAYLAKLLLEKGYRVIGGDRRTSRNSYWRLDEIGIRNEIETVYLELHEPTNIQRMIEKFEPSEIYNLAAQSFVSASFEMPLLTTDVTGIGVLRMLEAVRQVNPETKFYQASTSEMFGQVRQVPQNEETPFYPRSPYGTAKLFAHWSTVNYREAHGMFAVSGILFNHESPLRSREFVSRKITSTLADIKNGAERTLELGNLDAKRDWGFAGDYVEGMWLMMQRPEPGDYVLATGESHSVREFVNLSARHFGFEPVWEGEGTEEKATDEKTGREIVRVNPEFFRPAEVRELIGDASKAKAELGWKPEVSFENLVEMMCESELKRLPTGVFGD